MDRRGFLEKVGLSAAAAMFADPDLRPWPEGESTAASGVFLPMDSDGDFYAFIFDLTPGEAVFVPMVGELWKVEASSDGKPAMVVVARENKWSNPILCFHAPPDRVNEWKPEPGNSPHGSFWVDAQYSTAHVVLYMRGKPLF